MSNPSPSASDLVIGWQVVGTLPQVSVADGVWPADLLDPSQAIDDESLHFPNGGLFVLHFSAPYSRITLTLELNSLIVVRVDTTFELRCSLAEGMLSLIYQFLL